MNLQTEKIYLTNYLLSGSNSSNQKLAFSFNHKNNASQVSSGTIPKYKNPKLTKILFRALLISTMFTMGEMTAARAYQVFDPPLIRGKNVDRCINSWQYSDGCSKAATKHAANEFCKAQGLSYASYSKWKDGTHNPNEQWNVVKLMEEGNPIRRYFQNVRGSWVFKLIICE